MALGRPGKKDTCWAQVPNAAQRTGYHRAGERGAGVKSGRRGASFRDTTGRGGSDVYQDG